jgi:hypothetical protein
LRCPRLWIGMYRLGTFRHPTSSFATVPEESQYNSIFPIFMSGAGSWASSTGKMPYLLDSFTYLMWKSRGILLLGSSPSLVALVGKSPRLIPVCNWFISPATSYNMHNQLWSGMILRTIACNKMPTGFSKLPRSRGSFALADSEWGGAPAMGMMVVMLVPGSRTSSVFSETKNAPMASHGHNWWFIGFERILQVCQGIFPHFWTTPPRNQIPSPTKDGTLHRKAKPSKSALPWCLGQYSEFSCNCFITCHLIIKSYMIIN